MEFTGGLADILEPLNRLRAEQGEEAWLHACRNIAKQFLRQGPKGAEFARATFPELDFDAIQAELDKAEVKEELPASTVSPEEAGHMLVEAMRATMPGLRTQAQFNAFMVAFDALRMTANAIFEGDAQKTSQGEDAVRTAIAALKQATDVSAKLRDVPEAATSKAAEDFKRPPVQFGEREAQKRLLDDLDGVRNLEDLEAWYARNRTDLDRVVSPTLRNVLFDTIRAKKVSFGKS